MRKEINYPFSVTALCSAYDFNWDKDFDFAGERHDFWEIVCVLQGQVEVIEDEKIYVLAEGDMICHAPSEFHRIRSYKQTEPHVTVITFEHSGELPCNLSDGPFSLSSSEISKFLSFFYKAHSWFHSDNENVMLGAEAGAALTAFISELSTATHVSADTQSKTRGAREYQRIVKIMQTAVYENLRLPEIAYRAAVSVSTVKSLFSDFSSISPIKYYSLLQVEEAKKLLSDGIPVSDIAEQMNFSSPNYFCEFFKRITKQSPSKYKKR